MKAEKIGALALRALFYEVSASPKPGLVDRFDSGAHNDMDFFTFIDSGTSLTTYFKDCAAIGLNASLQTHELMLYLRPIGIEAEKSMLAATKGINTHKGLIYALGLICAALGRELMQNEAFILEKLPDRICQQVIEIVTPHEDHQREQLLNSETYGAWQYKRLGLLGARGEALGGYENVRHYGLPNLKYALKDLNMNFNDAMLFALLHLSINVADTNVIGRHDFEMLTLSQQKAKNIIQSGHFLTEEGKLQYHNYVKWSKENRVSHGGAADLLTLTVFFKFIEDEALKLYHT